VRRGRGVNMEGKESLKVRESLKGERESITERKGR